MGNTVSYEIHMIMKELNKLILGIVQPVPFGQPIGSCGYGGVAGYGGFCGNFL
jgi:hypothetical protein